MEDGGSAAVNEKDNIWECAPLHVALLYRQLECMKALLEAGASVSKTCEGMHPIHLAVLMGSFGAHREFSKQAVELLLQHNKEVSIVCGYDNHQLYELNTRLQILQQVDDCTRTALHVAAGLGLVDIVSVMLTAAPPTTKAEDGTETASGPGKLLAMKDKFGDTALHASAAGRGVDAEMVSATLGGRVPLKMVSRKIPYTHRESCTGATERRT